MYVGTATYADTEMTMTTKRYDPLMPIMADKWYAVNRITGAVIMGPFDTGPSTNDWITQNEPTARCMPGSWVLTGI